MLTNSLCLRALGDNRRTATATATSPVTLVGKSGADFHVFERDFAEAAKLMRDAAAERLARAS